MNRSLASAAAATAALRAAPLLAVGELLGGLAAGLDDAGELALVLGGEEGDLADVVQVEADGVIHDVLFNRSCGSMDSDPALCRLAHATPSIGLERSSGDE